MMTNYLKPSFGYLGVGVIIKHYLPSETKGFVFIPYQINILNDVRDWKISWDSIFGRVFKASLTFKCMTEHLFADFSYSIALDTYLWKQMMKMNRKLIHIWYNLDKKHLLFTKRKCHKFSWLFTAPRCSPRRRSICACRIACKGLVSIGLYSLSFGFLKKGFLLGKPCL